MIFSTLRLYNPLSFPFSLPCYELHPTECHLTTSILLGLHSYSIRKQQRLARHRSTPSLINISYRDELLCGSNNFPIFNSRNGLPAANFAAGIK